MTTLTKAEKAWINRVQKALNSCPSNRMGFFTIGDNDISVYNLEKHGEVCELMDSGKNDFGPSVDELDAYFCSLVFPSPVESTAG